MSHTNTAPGSGGGGGGAPDPHGASSHSGDVLPDGANQGLGAAYIDIAQIAAPADPAAGTRRLFVDSSDGKLKVRTSASTSVSLEEQGGGSGGHTIQEDGSSLTARTNLNFADGIVATDDAGNDQTDVNIDYATTEIVDVADTEAAGTSPKVPRADHAHKMGIITTKGDLLGFSTLPARLPVGTNGQFLTANSAQATGLEWVSGSSAAHNILSSSHSDSFSTDTPADGDVLTWVNANSRWEAVAPGGGGGANDLNEAAASALIDATSTGDAGSRADHFLGTSLGGAWTQEASAPTTTSVGNSSFGVQGGTTHYVRTYTPTGACRVEARVMEIGSVGLLIRDSGSGDSTGEGMLLDSAGDGLTFYSLDAGSYNARGGGATGVALPGSWFYMAIERDGSNNWSAYYSYDRAHWIQVGSTHAKTFTVDKMGFRFFSTNRGLVDFIDVVS